MTGERARAVAAVFARTTHGNRREAEGVKTYGDFAAGTDVRRLSLAPWPHTGGDGAFLNRYPLGASPGWRDPRFEGVTADGD